ncbi:MAG: hypothetical protein O3B74_05250, partial [Proteobacteria bacterium]|nr:hypothetical protein [Pseudomonadota bacterium]
LSSGQGRVPAKPASDGALTWRFQGRATGQPVGPAQTLLEAWTPGPVQTPLWIGFSGPSQKLTVSLAPEPGRSPHAWFGPAMQPSVSFDLQLALHPAMGPGGVLWREHPDGAWSTLAGASAWGPERLVLPEISSVGQGRLGPSDRPFRGEGLLVSLPIEAAETTTG